MPSRFVVLEGGDGCGKSTQVSLLAARLRAERVDVVVTFEPGATRAGADIRRLLLHDDVPVEPLAEALLMAADRAQHVHEVVGPALDAGRWVVSDRYVPSSLVYQGVVRGLGVEEVDALNRRAVQRAVPDLVVVVDVPDAVASERVALPTDRLEAAGREFHHAVREAYRSLARARGWAVVDGVGTRDEVADRVWKLVETLVSP